MASENKAPAVLMQRLPDGTEAFEIVHERYRELVRNPERAGRPGHIATEIHHLLNERTTRDELRDHFELDERTITAMIERARAYAEVRRRGTI
jgi:hypothetical protein